MSKKKSLRSFWDFEPSQSNKRNPFAVDPDFDAKNAKQDDKGPAITSLPRAMMKSVKKPLTAQKKAIAPAPQKSSNGVWFGITGLVVVVLVLSQTHILKNIAAYFNEKRVEDVAIKPSTGPVLGEAKPESTPSKNKNVVAKSASTPATNPAPHPSIKDAIGKKVTVKTAFLNVRADASLSAPVVANVKQGDEVTVLGAKGRWLQIGEGKYIGASHVNLDGVTGEAVASNENKDKKDAAPKAAPAKKVKTAEKFVPNQQLAMDNVKIRAGAGPKNKVVGYLRKGTTVTILEQKGVWLKIGENRYVHSGNLKAKQKDDQMIGH